MNHVPALSLSPAAARFLTGIVYFCAVALPGCNKEKAPEATAAETGPRAPSPPAVGDEPGPYVLRYFSPTTGELIVARKVSGVPVAARKQVLVVPDDANKLGPWLFVADLTKKEGDSYPVRTVDRGELEKQHAAVRPASASPSTAPTATDGEVILYKTAWCGYCRKASEYLRLKGVPFIEKDLERDAGAREDMLTRAKQAGVPASSLGGVPILYIKGRILTGFSRDAIDAALAG